MDPISFLVQNNKPRADKLEYEQGLPRTLSHMCCSLHKFTRRTNELGLLKCGVLTGKGNDGDYLHSLEVREECYSKRIGCGKSLSWVSLA
jgi:hypothetical protein